MKKLVMTAAILSLGLASGCMYGGVAADGGKAVIARNDMLLFGLLRKVYVCDIADGGLTNCATSTSP